MWDLDRSAARGMLALRGLYVFSHDNAMGKAPAHRLFERVQVEHVSSARHFTDYTVTVHEANLPDGVTCSILEG